MIESPITLVDLCGNGYAFNSRVSQSNSKWTFEDQWTASAVTGALSCAVGEMPHIVSAGCVRPETLSIINNLGLTVNAELYPFTDEQHRKQLVSRFIKQGRKIITQHAIPMCELPPEHCWIDPGTLAFLNNKANLGKFVGDGHLPNRKIIGPDALLNLSVVNMVFPAAVKVATEDSSGGGVGVIICNNNKDIEFSCVKFAGCEELVVEEFLAIRSNYCLNFAISRTREITYLGATEQIIENGSTFIGNWLGSHVRVPEAAISEATRVMQAGAELGYCGFAGLDVGVTEDDRFFIYDLNFRFNASTVPLLIFPQLEKERRLPMAKFTKWSGRLPFENFVKTVEKAVEREFLFPYNLFDPVSGGIPGGEPCVSGLLLGKTREDIEEKESEMRTMGLE